MTTLTPAQQRALAWLPSDGTWTSPSTAPKGIVDLEAMGLVEVSEPYPFFLFCLTPRGMEARREMEAAGKTQDTTQTPCDGDHAGGKGEAGRGGAGNG